MKVTCPRCTKPLGDWPQAFDSACGQCGWILCTLPAAGGAGAIRCLLPGADAWLAAWGGQLATFDGQARETLAALAAERDRPGLLPATAGRIQASLTALGDLLAQVHALIDPLLAAAPPPAPGQGEARDPRPLTHYLDLIYRDWAWEEGPGSEVEAALAEVQAVAGDRPLGRLLVLGGGACRLPYELHRAGRATETFVLDVDLLLVAAAARIVAGQPLALTEAPYEANDLEALAARHDLEAPGGPITDGSFHIVLANGLAPPFAPGSFDTVLTPWFIDVASTDVRDLIGTVHQLLAPGGRWLNFGPLVYIRQVPLACRFTAQEVLALAAGGGFRVDLPRVSTIPYTMSPLNGRGKLERTLAFCATKTQGAGAAPDGDAPPWWLVLPHLPVPRAVPVKVAGFDDPLVEAIWSAVDGSRGIRELAALLAPRLQSATMRLPQVQDAVRECLAATHPAARGP
jgi:hypothetical protein